MLRYRNRLRAAQGMATPHRPRPGPPLVAVPKRVLTPRTAAWAVLRRPERRGTEDRTLLAGLREQSCLVHGREAKRLDPWL